MLNKTEQKIVNSLKKFGLPLKNFQKFPTVKGWQERIWSDFSDQETSNTTGFGVNCGRAGVIVFDLDESDTYSGISSWNDLLQEHDAIDTLTVSTPNGGLHVYFKLTEAQKASGKRARNSVKSFAEGIDIRAEGGQVVGPTSTVWLDKDDHSKGKGTYAIVNPAKAQELPEWLFEMVYEDPQAKVRAPVQPVTFTEDDRHARYITEAVSAILCAASGTRNDTVNTQSYTVGLKGVPPHIAEVQLKNAARMIGLSEGEINSTVDRSLADGFSAHTPYVAPPKFEGGENASGQTLAKKSGENDPLNPDHFYTDSYIGDAFMRVCNEDILAVEEWNGWATYNDATGLWAQTKNERIRNRFTNWYKNVLHPTIVENGNYYEQRLARPYLNTSTAQNAIEYVRGEYGVKANVFDTNKDVILTPAGEVVDLRTGEIRDATASDRFTKSANENYVAGFKSDRWEKILSAFPEDVLDYLQVVIGQSITGHQPTDSAVYFFHGGGSNGKSLFFNVFNEIFGEYADTPDSNILLRSQQNNTFSKHVFKGNRVAILEELPEANWLDAAMLKKLVGTKYMRGAQKFKDEETFENTSTIFVNTNHKPLVSDLDHGTWRRLKVIDMPYTFVKAEEFTGKEFQRIRDNDLTAPQHQAEIYKAAMAWVVEGAVKWYANGRQELSEPESMIRAHKQWRRGQDKIEQWFDEYFVTDENSFVLNSDLYDIYKIFLKENGYATQNSKTFMDSFTSHSLFEANDLELMQRARARKGFAQSIWTPPAKSSFDDPKPRVISGPTSFVIGIRLRGSNDDELDQEVTDQKFAEITSSTDFEIEDDFDF